MKKIILIFWLFFISVTITAQNESIVKNYYDNGNIKEIQSFKDEKLHGVFLTFSTDGIKTAEAIYVDGLKDGNWRIWSDNGVLLFDMFYEKGNRIGLWKMFNEEGILLSTKQY